MKNRDSSSALLKKNFTINKINKSPQDQVKDSIKNFIKNKNRNINEQSNENIQLYVKDKTTELKNEDDIENRQIFKNKIEKSDRSIRQITEHTFKNFDSLDEINKIHNKKLDENQIKKENMTFDKISQYFFSNFDIMCKNLLNEFEMKSLQISSKINKLDKMIKNIQVSVPSNVLPIINNELGNEIHKKNTTNFFSNSDKIENEKNEEIIENKINLVNRVFNNRPINEKNKEEYYSDEEQIHQENNFENLNNIPEKMDLKHNLQNQINNNLYTEKTFKNKNHLEKNVKISKEIYEKLYKEIYHKIKKEQVQKTPEIVKIWENSLNEISKNNFDSAYESILNSGTIIYYLGDDIYLLRLIYLTGPALDKLNNDLSKRVLLRINQISRSHQIQQVTYNLIKQCNETKIILSIDSEDQNEILETLYEFSGISSELGVIIFSFQKAQF